MTNSRYEQAKQFVESIFPQPKDVLAAADLSRAQKVELLSQWKQDLHQLIVASGEGMTAPRPGRAAETLGKVDAALNQLGTS